MYRHKRCSSTLGMGCCCSSIRNAGKLEDWSSSERCKLASIAYQRKQRRRLVGGCDWHQRYRIESRPRRQCLVGKTMSSKLPFLQTGGTRAPVRGDLRPTEDNVDRESTRHRSTHAAPECPRGIEPIGGADASHPPPPRSLPERWWRGNRASWLAERQPWFR